MLAVIKKIRSEMTRLFLPDGEELASRLASLYGRGQLSEGDRGYIRPEEDMILVKMEGILRANRRRAMAFGVCWLLLAAAAFSAYLGASSGIYFGPDGAVKAVDRPGQGEGTRRLEARVSALSGSELVSKRVEVRVEESGGERRPPRDLGLGYESKGMELEREVQSAIRTVNEAGGKKMVLPRKLEDGRKLIWELERENNFPLIFALLFLGIYFLNRYRFKEVEELEKRALESVRLDLPTFMNQLVLLLRSGLIFSEAFKRALDNRKKRGLGQDESYFFLQMEAIRRRCVESNASLTDELIDFARRVQTLDLLRFSGIVKENIAKGTDLTSKLESENRVLWLARKTRAEERGGIAETQMTIPLVMNLAVLVTITIAPALLEM